METSPKHARDVSNTSLKDPQNTTKQNNKTTPKQHRDITKKRQRQDRDTTETWPRHPQNNTETSPRQDQDKTKTRPRQDRDTTETRPRHDRDITETTPKQHRDITKKRQRQDRDTTETWPRHHQNNTKTLPGQDRDILGEFFSGACAAPGRLIHVRPQAYRYWGKKIGKNQIPTISVSNPTKLVSPRFHGHSPKAIRITGLAGNCDSFQETWHLLTAWHFTTPSGSARTSRIKALVIRHDTCGTNC